MARDRKQFLVDEKGQRKSVVIPIKEYEELLEDLEDLALIAERKDEPTESLEIIKKRLEDKWNR